MTPTGMASLLDDLSEPPVVRRYREALAADLCTHDRLMTIGPSRGDFTDDHETADSYCIDCKGLFVATIWKTERATELRAMTNAEIERSGVTPLTTSQVGSAFGGQAA